MASKWERFTTKPGILGVLLIVLPTAKFVWNLIAAAANLQFLVNSGSWLWTQMDKGVVQLPTFVIGVALVLWALLRREAESTPQPPLSPMRNDLQGAVEFYLNRDASRPRFDALMRSASNVWVAAYQATTLRGDRVWWDKIERLILLEQGGFAVDLRAVLRGFRSVQIPK